MSLARLILGIISSALNAGGPQALACSMHIARPVPGMERRKMLSRLVKGAGLVVFGTVAVPSVATLLSPVLNRRRTDAWRPLGPVEGFPPGATRKALVEVPRNDWARALGVQAVYVWHSEEEGLVVFSRKCTDLGCPIVWDSGSQWFFCPCHGGIFDQRGRPQAGPPQRPLYRYAHRVRDGILEIDLTSAPPAA